MKFLNVLLFYQFKLLEKEFFKLGIRIVGLKNIKYLEAKQLYNLTKRIFTQCKFLRNYVTEIIIDDFDKLIDNGELDEKCFISQGITFYPIEENKIHIRIYLNTNRTEKDKKNRLEVIKCPNSTYFETVLAHEYGHAIEIKLLELVNKWDIYGTNQTIVDNYMYMYEEIKGSYEFISKEYDLINICLESLKGLTNQNGPLLSFAGEWLGVNATINYQECFAESFSQYFCSDNPSILSAKIVEKSLSKIDEILKDR